MSSSNQTFSSVFSVPMSVFQYPNTASASLSALPRIPAAGDRFAPPAPLEAEAPDETLDDLRHGITLTEEALAARLALARAEATHQTEQRLRQEYEARAAAESAVAAEKISTALAEFESSRSAYFARVEVEIVHLALSIAGKILHREAQVDPMLVAALVQIALSQLKDGSPVSIRVRPEAAAAWTRHFAADGRGLKVTIVEDPDLEPGGCQLETELGSANFSLDAQLKEVEQGFFDVLAQRP